MNRIEAFYDASALREWERLDRHPLEFALTRRALEEYIPAGASILDVGGGPGRYAIHLSREGHTVTLLDLSKGNLLLAAEKAAAAGVKLGGSVHGNALDLSNFADGSFDVVLLLGPLYHLLEEKDREKAVAEAVRVLRPGGLLFAAGISRYAQIFYTLIHMPEEIGQEMTGIQRILESGISRSESGFTDAYFAFPEEMVPLMEGHGLWTLRFMSAEGFAILREEEMKSLSPQAFEQWVDLNWRLAAEPSLVGSAMHFLYIGRK